MKNSISVTKDGKLHPYSGGPVNLHKLQQKCTKTLRWRDKFYNLSTDEAPKNSRLLDLIHGKDATPEEQLRNDCSYQRGPLGKQICEELAHSQQELLAQKRRLSLARITDPAASQAAALQP